MDQSVVLRNLTNWLRFDYDDLRADPARRSSFERVLVLAHGSTPTLDYYVRPRLSDVPHAIVDTQRAAPRELTVAPGDYVLVCRYLPPRWCRSLLSCRTAGLGVVFDDDFVAFLRDPSISLAYRLHVARHGIGALTALSGRLTDVFVASATLRARYSAARARVLLPAPGLDDLLASAHRPSRHRIAFHAQASHLEDHAFAAAIVESLLTKLPRASIEVDVVGPKAARRYWHGLAGVRFRAELDWPKYRESMRREQADLMIAPLLPTRVNRARSPSKVIDAVRLGAAAVLQDLEPYHPLQGIAPLVAGGVEEWSSVIRALLADEEARARMAARLRETAACWRAEATSEAFP